MKTKQICLWCGSAAALLTCLFALWLNVLGRYNFSYLEEWRTLIVDPLYVQQTIGQLGGVAIYLADWLVQWFASPMVGVVVTAVLLALCWLFLALAFRVLAKNWIAMPLALLPLIAIAVLLYNTNFQYFAVVSLLFMSFGLWATVNISAPRSRMLCAVAVALLLVWTSGAVATLFCLLVLVFSLFQSPRQSWLALVPLLAVVFVAWRQTLGGEGGSLRHLLLPDGFFTLRLKAGSLIYLPFTLTVAAAVLSGIISLIDVKKVKQSVLVLVATIECLAVVAFAVFATRQYTNPQLAALKEVSYWSRKGDWDRVVRCCNAADLQHNILFQNYRNLALAEQGKLADELFAAPVRDIQSIYIQGDKKPHVLSLLSDIYFSMGHIALSQRYAFEAFESSGNRSPRMLQRLVETSLVFGEYELADKYLNLLTKTTHYANWAKSYKSLLRNDLAVQKHPILGEKKRCLFSDNRLSGSLGLDDDLKQILRANPLHYKSLHYLGSLCLLMKDFDRFGSVMREFYSDKPLPRAFAEAAAVMMADDSVLCTESVVDEAVAQRYEKFLSGDSAEKNSFWYFLKYVR